MIELYKARRHKEDNERYLDMMSYHLAQRDYGTAKELLKNVSKFTKCGDMSNRVGGLFITKGINKEYFGIAENIVGSMTNIVFSGNVKIKVKDEVSQALIDELYFDGYLIDSIKETYKTAISMAGKAKAYLFFNTIQEYNNRTQVKIKDEFVNFEVVPSFEIKHKGNVLEREFFKTIELEEDVEIRKYVYTYNIDNEKKTTLTITGFDDEGKELEPNEVKSNLGIDTLEEYFDFIPFIEYYFGEGMLPNILWVENSLAENLYFQDEDLANSQTRSYMPENSMYETEIDAGSVGAYHNKYKTKVVIKGDNLDGKEMVTHVAGHSAISEIEKNMALNILQSSLDAKISPVSLGYSLIDKIASNTDIGPERERATIRLRENHIERLKVNVAKTVQLFLYLNGILLDEKDIAMLINPYITPSLESTINNLSKAVQFGIMSRYEAVRQLHKDELDEDEINAEYERIKELGTQIDYNVDQRQQANKGETNILKAKELE